MHACEGEMVCESVNTKIPYFNAPIYLENKVSRGSHEGLVPLANPTTTLDIHWQSRRDSRPH